MGDLLKSRPVICNIIIEYGAALCFAHKGFAVGDIDGVTCIDGFAVGHLDIGQSFAICSIFKGNACALGIGQGINDRNRIKQMLCVGNKCLCLIAKSIVIAFNLCYLCLIIGGQVNYSRNFVNSPYGKGCGLLPVV